MDPNQLKYRIIEAKTLNLVINEFNLGIELDIERIKWVKAVRLDYSDESNILSVMPSVIFYFDNGKEDMFKMFEFECRIEFLISQSASIIQVLDEKINIPEELSYTFLNIALGTLRGMLAILLSSTFYRDIIMPVVTPDEIASMLKKAESNEKVGN